ncbi:MAG TPA: NAD(P)H-dependent oxidoreductase [Candidatus Avamphibacillus sp.]|nr:NAD(P)H-dependent oxidoreductase [Candidatus Avamphibacillus sp.]
MLNIGVILGSTRETRNGEAVAKWILDFAEKRQDKDVTYELVDLADYRLPLLGEKLPEGEQEEAEGRIKAWSEKMASFDGYIVVPAEYNHMLNASLKNALDYLNPELNNKAAGFAAYGSLGGARAIESLRIIFGELQVADVRTAVTFSLMTDFENMSVFKPANYHADNANGMLDQLLSWSKTLKSVREESKITQ